MNVSQQAGLMGAAAMALGLFSPVFSWPLVGSINYFEYSSGRAALILFIAAASALLAYNNKHGWLFFTGGFSVFLLVLSATNINIELGISNTPWSTTFKAFASHTARYEWGWLILGLGSLTMIASALLKTDHDEIDMWKSMNDSQRTGFVGAAVMASSLFLPVLSWPHGVINYFEYSLGGAMLILFIAAISSRLAYQNKHGWLFFIGIFSFLILLFSIVNIKIRIASGDTPWITKMNPLAQHSTDYEWGWITLGLGSLIMIISALVKADYDEMDAARKAGINHKY